MRAHEYVIPQAARDGPERPRCARALPLGQPRFGRQITRFRRISLGLFWFLVKASGRAGGRASERERRRDGRKEGKKERKKERKLLWRRLDEIKSSRRRVEKVAELETDYLFN